MSPQPGEKILSADEMSALLSTAGDKQGGGPPQKAAPAKKVLKYDIRKPDRLSKEVMRSVHLIHGNFQRTFSYSLAAYLRAFVEVRLLSIDQLPYSQFLENLCEPTCYNSISVSPMEGKLVLEMSPPVVFPMIDLLLGGSGLPARDKRMITDIEWVITDGVIKLALKDLKEAWKPVVELDLSIVGHESKPQSLQFLSQAESVVAVAFQLRVGNNTGVLNLGIPAILIKLLGSKFVQQQWHMRRKEDVERDVQRISSLLPDVPVDMRAEIRGNFISVSDLLGLQVGDVVSLNHRSEKPVVLSVEGIPRFMGQVVRRQEHRVIYLEYPASERDLYTQ